MKFTKF